MKLFAKLAKKEIDTEPQMHAESGEIRYKLPVFAVVFYILTAISALLTVLFLLLPSFSDFFNRHISSVLRAVLAHLTNWIPFSLAEFMVIFLPVLLVVLILFAIQKYADNWHNVFIYCMTLLSVVGLFFSLFTLGFSPAYRGSTLSEKLELEQKDVSARELYETALLLADATNREAEFVAFEQSGPSVMPYNYAEMNDRLLAAYDKACEKYDFIQRLSSRLKPVMLSEAMSYTHVTGVYSFFTGEANINVAFPDYTVPFTAAHELAHQRGIAREDEANFVAFLVCMEANDPYIRYSGYLNLYEYVASALYSADPAMYTQAQATLHMPVRYEMSAFTEFFKKYQKSKVSEVSEAVNNAFLLSQGTEGTKSYGMVVDLAVAYYREG